MPLEDVFKEVFPLKKMELHVIVTTFLSFTKEKKKKHMGFDAFLLR